MAESGFRLPADGRPRRIVIAAAKRDRQDLSMLQHAILLIFAAAYGFLLQSLPVLQFKDRANYLNYAENAADILSRYAEQGVLKVFANEPVWLLFNTLLAYLFDPEAVIRAVVFVSAALFAYVFTRADPRNSVWLMLFLLMPQLLKNFITHLRQGLALAVFFAGYFSPARFRRWLLMLLAPLVHASFFFVVPFVILPDLLRRMHLAIDVRLALMGAFSLLASLSIGLVAALVGARQLDAYDFAMTDVSGLGFVYWLMIGGLFVLQGRRFLTAHQAAAGILLLYLLSYFFVEVTGRIFESGMPMVLIGCLALTGWRRWIFIGSFVPYSITLWVMRLSSETPF